jgi:hypothetical protein
LGGPWIAHITDAIGCELQNVVLIGIEICGAIVAKIAPVILVLIPLSWIADLGAIVILIEHAVAVGILGTGILGTGILGTGIARACILRACILRTCILRACILRTCISRACILRACILRACILRT